MLRAWQWNSAAIGAALTLSLASVEGVCSEQSGQVRIQIRIALVMQDLSVRPVPRKPVIISPDSGGDSSLTPVHLVTSLDGRAEARLSPGNYRVVVSEPVPFEGKKLTWDVRVNLDGEAQEPVVELSNDNALIGEQEPAAAPLTTEGQVFSSCKDGVVTVESEMGHGSGFVVDPRGLVVTNAHVVEGSRELVIAFDSAHRFSAEAMVVDSEHDVAVLRYNDAAFPQAVALRIAQSGDAQPLRVGDPVIAIGSPLNQDKIITKGIVSKVGDGVIISDVNINHGNSGGPLLNAMGSVIGITTFKDLDPTGGGISGIVRIEAAGPLIQKARAMAEAKAPPSPDALPSVPEGEFPVADLKKQLTEHTLNPSDYSARRSTFDVQVMTPALKYFLETKDAAEKAENRAKKEKHSTSAVKDPDADPYTNLRVWRTSLGDFRPVLEIYMLPRLKATGGSIFGAMLSGDASVLHYRYKSDFDKAELVVDGKTVAPIRRSRFTRSAKFASTEGFANDESFAGVYTFGIEFLKDLNEDSHVAIVIHDGLKPEKPVQVELDPRTVWKIRNDFNPLLGPPSYPEPEVASGSGGTTG